MTAEIRVDRLLSSRIDFDTSHSLLGEVNTIIFKLKTRHLNKTSFLFLLLPSFTNRFFSFLPYFVRPFKIYDLSV